MNIASLLALALCLGLVEITRSRRLNPRHEEAQSGSYTKAVTQQLRRELKRTRNIEEPFKHQWTRHVRPEKVHSGSYTKTVSRQLQRELQRTSNSGRTNNHWTGHVPAECEDRLRTSLCVWWVELYETCSYKRESSDKRTIIRNRVRTRLRGRCAKTCGLCTTLRDDQRPRPTTPRPRFRTRLSDRKQQPYPHMGVRESGDRNTPRNGVYQIFTKRIFL